jgi:TRAP-type C4-dicarboxylate transport system permease small subunit
MNGLENKYLRGIDALAGTIVATSLFGMMLLTAVDVFSRYLLSQPIAAALELTETLMAITIFAALPLVSLRGSHITVDLLGMLVGPRISTYLDALGELVCAGAIGVLSWQMAERAIQLYGYGETTAVLKYLIWPAAAIIALGSAVSVPIFIARFGDHVGLFGRRSNRRETLNLRQGKPLHHD